MINITLDNYNGPLDLLLSLIEKENENIYETNVCSIIDQYLEIIGGFDTDLESMSSFLIMAARLLEIKSYMLLPPGTEDEIDENPIQELIEHLIEYKIYKSLSFQLRDMYENSYGTFTKKSSIDSVMHSCVTYQEIHDAIGDTTLDDLKTVYLSSLENQKKRNDPFEPKDFYMQKDKASFDDIKIKVAEYIKQQKECKFSELPGCNLNKDRKVMVFLSILELSKQGEIVVEQENSDISIKKSLSAS